MRAAQCAYDHEEVIRSSARATEESSLESDERRRKVPIPPLPREVRNPAGVPVVAPFTPIARRDESTRVIQDLQDRVRRLEQLISDQPHGSIEAPRQSSLCVSQTPGSSTNLGTLNVKGSRSRFYGQNQKSTLLREFDDARKFMGGCFKDPSMTAMFRECQSLQKNVVKKYMPSKRDGPLIDSSVLSQMFGMIPARVVADKLVRIYIANFENTLRILHIPTFLRQCERFWTHESDSITVFAVFIPQILITMVIASCLDDSIDVEDDMTEEHFDISGVCDLVQDWLNSLHGKQRVNLSTIRTQTLLLLAHQTRLKRIEETWSEVGALVRSAMTTGLHRDPAAAPDISVFEGEQRRRLWITIVEMDLQISMNCGMPSMTRVADFGWCVPSNVDDVDLFEEMTSIPMGKSSDEWTDSLCQVTLATSLQWRLEATDHVNNIGGEVDYQEQVDYCRNAEELLRDLPPILKYDHISDQYNDGSGRLLGRIMLDVYLRRMLLYIYRTLTVLGFPDARTACVQSCLVILSHQDAFDPNVADLDVINSKKYWDLFYTFCRNDVVQAALSVCSEIKAMSQLSSSSSSRVTPSGLTGRTHSHFVPANPMERASAWPKANLTRTTENAVESLVRRAGKLGSDLKDPLCISIVLQSVRSNSFTSNKQSLMREGAVSVIKACRQNLRNKATTGYNAGEPNNTELQFFNSSTAETGPYMNGHSTITPVTMPHRQDYSILGNSGAESSNGFLIDGEIDFGAIDFGFGADWDLDHTWV